MATINAGRVTFISKGEYNNATQYYKFDLVNYNGGSYIAKGNTLGNLPTNETYWQLIAEKGQTGQTGATGNGISTIQKTSTSGLVDTYTITYTDGTTSTFNITNGEDGEVTQAEFDYYKTLYNAMPKLTGTGTDITIDDTAESILKMDLSGNSYQESTTGKNLFNKIAAVENQNKYILNSDGTITNSNNWGEDGRNFFNNISLSAGTYTLSYIPKLSSDLGERFCIKNMTTNTDITNSRITIINSQLTYYTFTLEANAEIGICIMPNQTADGIITLTNIQLESGSTATSYEPYTGGQASPNPDYPQDIEVVTGDNEIKVEGKNLIPFTNQDFTLKGIRYYVKNGNLYLNGTSQGETFSSDTQFKNNFSFYLEAGTYHLDRNTYNSAGYIKKYSDDTNIVVNAGNFTLTEKTQVYISFYMYNVTFNNFLVPLQLEHGSTATSYVEHKEQTYPINLGNTELCKIGDYKDYFYEDSGKWYLHKAIDKVVLDGSESGWSYPSSNRFNLDNIINDYKKEQNQVTYYCDNYKGYGQTDNNADFNTLVSSVNYGFNFTCSQNNFNIRFKDTRYSNIDNFKTWLSTHNVTVQYVLATPTNTQITDTTLIEQLNALKYALSYQNQTNISQTNDGCGFAIDYVALYDMQKLVGA